MTLERHGRAWEETNYVHVLSEEAQHIRAKQEFDEGSLYFSVENVVDIVYVLTANLQSVCFGESLRAWERSNSHTCTRATHA